MQKFLTLLCSVLLLGFFALSSDIEQTLIKAPSVIMSVDPEW
ncbi:MULTISPECIES: hypothetical protein [Brevibacillus]|jgi:hypothetical protein|nr:hypothetical protein [Brevibacillus borstelensis]MED1851488.1 hypothetical protein [Brevibacillus borstelensis]MED1885231.1 hypothetical protein [Brevibacillus borstelensis]MED2008752.1 hypothetical protein [Brevibacillus borstelensis]WNF03436.1 hypothetical protein RFB14_13335 [Brevibacillus borstelensis]GED54643.1 hypothetical protein BBO01nite_38840 [Brevibacillus borstelensis]